MKLPKLFQVFVIYLPQLIFKQFFFIFVEIFAFLGANLLFFRRIPLKLTILAVTYVCKISAKLDKKSKTSKYFPNFFKILPHF